MSEARFLTVDLLRRLTAIRLTATALDAGALEAFASIFRHSRGKSIRLRRSDLWRRSRGADSRPPEPASLAVCRGRPGDGARSAA